MSIDADIVIIGSGMGGAVMAHALAPTGRQIVILERGDHLGDSDLARSDTAIFRDGVFRPDESWRDGEGAPFNPGNYYNVGGNSKFYGAVMLRYRREDFAEMRHMDGVSPAWPITYEEMESWYQQAEELFEVRGDASVDPTEPPHSGTYPFSPIAHEAAIGTLEHRLRTAGVTPSPLPLAVDVDAWTARAATPWDAYPDTTGAKKDAAWLLGQVLERSNVALWTGAIVTRLDADATGKVTSVRVTQGTTQSKLTPNVCILSAGAVNSAALLLKSANDNFPRGLANGSDMVGRHFMNHNCSAVLAIHPTRRNKSVYQKTLQFNDFYLTGGPSGEPLGNVQLLGKVSGAILAAQSALPLPVANWIAARSVDWYVMSEDLPNPDSRVQIKNGQIVLDWKRSNWAAQEHLVGRTKEVLRKAGYSLVLSRAFDRRTPSHQCGTTRFGTNPSQSVLDLQCRAHEHPNLYVVDAGFLPTSAAVNPALTIAAQALRVADHIKAVAA